MKLAVFFPGIGYTLDKPLMYYSKKSAAECGFDIIEVNYNGFPAFDEKKEAPEEYITKCYKLAFKQTEAILKKVDFSKAEKILFVSKSLGTVVAASYAEKYNLKTDNIFYTPIAGTFQFKVQKGIAFHGSADPAIETERLKELCSKNNLPLIQFANANHSLETGNMQFDLINMIKVMEETHRFIKEV